MEIAPIPGIRTLSAVKAPRTEFSPPPIFDIEGSARAGDDQAQRQRRKAEGAEEDGEEDLLLDAEAQESSAVDYFA